MSVGFEIGGNFTLPCWQKRKNCVFTSVEYVNFSCFHNKALQYVYLKCIGPLNCIKINYVMFCAVLVTLNLFGTVLPSLIICHRLCFFNQPISLWFSAPVLLICSLINCCGFRWFCLSVPLSVSVNLSSRLLFWIANQSSLMLISITI